MRATLPQDCRDALRATLSEHAECAVGKPDLDRAQRDKFIERDAYMSFDTDPAIYDVVRMAYEVAGIALDD